MEKYVYIFLAVYYVVINIVGFSLMYSDKKRARKGQWRISEASLFVTALLFGALFLSEYIKENPTMLITT